MPSATILLVDDDAAVRRALSEALAHEGYEVLEAASGDQALEITQQSGCRIRLLLTDVCMPGMSGPALAAALRERYPSIKLLYMSGYSEYDLRPEARLIRKPFRLQTLKDEVKSLLSADTSRKPAAGAETGRRHRRPQAS